MTEDNDKIYHLLISRGIDENNEYGKLIKILYSKYDFLWKEAYVKNPSAFGEAFFKDIDIGIILSGLYSKNKESIQELAKILNKYNIPIILLPHYDKETIDEELEKIADTTVDWNIDKIIDEIKSIENNKSQL
ncbi:MAG: nuclease [Methanobrevibacter sp.]|jgi:sugar phosphate isomerase/epimerase|nr:nuclease [Candidatus Methanovirga procula]